MTEEEFDQLRASGFAIAYRMLGSVSEAEDVVQEGFLRLHRARACGERIASPRAFLSTVVSRLSLDHLRSAQVRRETYVGEWLPEPLVASADDDPARKAEIADSLSLAFLVLLESLSPEQRAAFLLREVFDEPYDRSAEIVGTSEQNARQLATRARRHVEQRRPRFEASREQREQLATASSRLPRRVISTGWRSCSPTTSSSAPTAAARRPPPHARSTAAPGWRAC
jgi:RNA polymerase sigma-70 factor (ECF subfamily)